MQHPDLNSMKGFSRRALPGAEMLAVSEHLAACEACQARMGALAASPVEWFPAEGAALHLSEEEIAAAAGREMLIAEARRHLAECADCRREVEDVRRFVLPGAGSVVVMRPRKMVVVAWMVGAAVAAGVVLAVFAGHRAPVTDSPTMVAELQDGGLRIELDARGQLHGTLLRGEDAAVLTQVLSSHQVPKAQVAIAGNAGTEILRGDATQSTSFKVLMPLREKTLGMPEFRWEAMAGAKSYVVEIHDDAFRLVERSPRLTATSWRPSEALPEGKEYMWVVKAETVGGTVLSPRPPMPEARFAVASAEEIAGVDEVRKRDGDEHLLLAATYAKLGMTDEARSELDELGRENPGSGLVRDLESSLGAR